MSDLKSSIIIVIFASKKDMARQTIDRKDIAKSLFINGNYTQEEIAAKVSTTRQTVARWMREGGWEELKASLTITPDQIIAQIQRGRSSR